MPLAVTVIVMHLRGVYTALAYTVFSTVRPEDQLTLGHLTQEHVQSSWCSVIRPLPPAIIYECHPPWCHQECHQTTEFQPFLFNRFFNFRCEERKTQERETSVYMRLF
jgi:hypothetical protein